MIEVTEIKLHQSTKILDVHFSDNSHFELSCEYLRVFSPSAEVRGHGNHEPKLIKDKHNVNIIGIDPVGQYAIKLIFDDGHDSGLYSWELLYELGTNYQTNWQRYQQRLLEE